MDTRRMTKSSSSFRKQMVSWKYSNAVKNEPEILVYVFDNPDTFEEY